MRRIGVLLLALMLVLTCFSLVGCGGEKKDTGTQPVTGQEDAQPSEEISVDELFAKGKQVKGMSFDFIMTMADNELMTGKMWIQGEQFKQEFIIEGNQVINIFDNDTFYSYRPAENMAIKFNLNDMQGNSEGNVDSPINYLDNVDTEVMTQVGTEYYDGAKCKVLLFKDKESTYESKMWVRLDYGIPVRIEATDSDGTKSVMEYKNIKVGSLPADTFKLPSGVEVQDLSEMRGN